MIGWKVEQGDLSLSVRAVHHLTYAKLNPEFIGRENKPDFSIAVNVANKQVG